ncbi:MAG: PP2C family protein-serine/threonine phosphatase [Mycobacteriales bacterium]
MSLALRYAARSDRGLIREGNEDSVYAGPRLLAVADGMGGMAAGEVASHIVVSQLAHLDEDVPPADLTGALRRAIQSANAELRDEVSADPALEGMGTTLTAILFAGSRIGLAHIGDSRAYLYRGNSLEQITRDDTYVQMLVDEGQITEDEATTHPQRSLLTRALDGREVEPDVYIREVRVGDRYLLCTDGLSGVVSEETIAQAIDSTDPRAAVDQLIDLALRGGGPDNVTCIVADVVDVAYAGDDAPVVGGAASSRDDSEPTADTPAGRAALMAPRSRPDGTTPRRPGLDVEPEHPRRRWPIVLAVVGVVALFAALGLGAYAYVRTQYYVGATSDDEVAVFRGVPGSLAGFKFSSVEQRTDLKLADLKQVARQQVRDGITADNRDDANQIVNRLRKNNVLPECPPPTETAPPPGGLPNPTPTATVSPAPTGTPSPLKPGVDCRKASK